MNAALGTKVALGVVLALMLLEGCVWALAPGLGRRVTESVPPRVLQVFGIVEVAVAVALLLSVFA